MDRSPLVSEFYERRRRLAYTFAVVSAALLLGHLWLGAVGIEALAQPRLVVAGDDLWALHRVTAEETPGARVYRLDRSLRAKDEPLRLGDDPGALLPGKDGLQLFFGSRYSVVRDGQTVRGGELGQPWEVVAAQAGWIFGVHDGKILARREADGAWSEPVTVAPAGVVERLSCSAGGDGNLLVAWKEKSATAVRTARFDGRGFAPGPEFQIGETTHWEAVPLDGRVIFVTYHRKDRTFKHVLLRVRCCAGCGHPPPPETIVFADPILLLGRGVMGMAAARFGDRLVFFLTRWTTPQVASVSLSTLHPDPESPALRGIATAPVWRHAIAAVFPLLMMFFSFSLIFLGFILLRERGRISRERTQPAPPREQPAPADVLQRAMAHILDVIIVSPLLGLTIQLLDLWPETSDDPGIGWRIGLAAGLYTFYHTAYHLLMEWTKGWTLGKRIIGIRVAEADGSPLTFRGALLRNLFRVIETEPLGLLSMVMIARTSRRQRLGDMLGRSVVLQEMRGAEPPKDAS